MRTCWGGALVYPPGVSREALVEKRVAWAFLKKPVELTSRGKRRPHTVVSLSTCHHTQRSRSSRRASGSQCLWRVLRGSITLGSTRSSRLVWRITSRLMSRNGLIPISSVEQDSLITKVSGALYYCRGRVTHICVSDLTIIGSDNGLSPDRRQALIWINAWILLTGPFWDQFQWKFNRNSNIYIHENAFENVGKMPSVSSRPQCVKHSKCGLCLIKHKYTCVLVFPFLDTEIVRVYEVLPHGRDWPANATSSLPAVASDGLVTQGARASAAMSLTSFSRNITASAPVCVCVCVCVRERGGWVEVGDWL